MLMCGCTVRGSVCVHTRVYGTMCTWVNTSKGEGVCVCLSDVGAYVSGQDNNRKYHYLLYICCDSDTLKTLSHFPLTKAVGVFVIPMF